MTKRQVQIGIVLSVFAFTATAHAQVDEIVVTATKRETTIQTTAGAISAMSGEQMKFRGQVNAQDMAFNVPGLVYGELLGTPQITIRGVGLSVETGVAEMGVATYLNGVFLSKPGLTNLALGDLERAEVLRGPQGTLYGRNATGGAVKPVKENSVAAVCNAFPCFELTVDCHIAVPPPRLSGKGASGSFLAREAMTNGYPHWFAFDCGR